MSGKRCPDDCVCGRHKKDNPEKAAKRRRPRKKCPDDCTCGRHRRVITEQHRQNIVAANQARTGESHSCLDDCTCDRHRGYHFGGSKKGRTFSEEARKNIARGARKRVYSATKKYKSQRVSKAEYMLAPYLAALGYTHNDKRTLSVGRKWPDFYDDDKQRLFEYFGNYHHKDPGQEEEIVEFYRQLGWSCIVLWESDVFNWMELHQDLVTGEQHREAIKTAHKIVPFQFRPKRSF